MNVTGMIHSLDSFGTFDGPGLRFVVFMQGCPLRCAFCHNPDTWSPTGGMELRVCELMKKIEPCRNFIRTGGVTVSGGEPLFQPEFTLELLIACRRSGFHTALDTAGSMPLEVSRAVIDAADLLLLDIKALDPELCRRITGQDNRNELATLDYCEETGKPVWIRHVLVPGWTLDTARLRDLAGYLAKFNCVEKIDLLPFHKMAAFKWRGLGLADPLADTSEPSSEACRQAEQLFTGIKRR